MDSMQAQLMAWLFDGTTDRMDATNSRVQLASVTFEVVATPRIMVETRSAPPT